MMIHFCMDSEEDPCHKAYELVEECIGNANRDWSKCQTELRVWKECRVKANNASAATATNKLRTKPPDDKPVS